MLVESKRLQYAIYHPLSLFFSSRAISSASFAHLSAFVDLRPSTSNALPRRCADSLYHLTSPRPRQLLSQPPSELNSAEPTHSASRRSFALTTFFMDLNFDVPHPHQFIGHAEEFKTFDRAYVSIYDLSVHLYLYLHPGAVDHRGRELDCQLSCLAQVCSLSFPLTSALEELEIGGNDDLSLSHWKDDMENAQWLELLDLFAALKNLYLTNGIVQRFCQCGALQEPSGERATEVLPTLCNLFVRGS
ncbi:hypothetical protein BC827DRAFT_1379100 [Russula dissimulans]|nr:hypothetical protein BC827DRAFT_1379100 [Russula dissimulans]